MTGWIGIHGTIDKEGGKDNDANFVKTPYYTPNQIRLYVRNKLAVENFLNILNSTATYANYIEGEKEYYAYFTDLTDLQEQWGDDWNDTPYEHNAGCPYDSMGKNEHTILKVPFTVVSENNNGYSHWVKFPCDYGNGNSPFSVEGINAGAIPWIFVSYYNMAKNKKFLAINAGINPSQSIISITNL